MTRSDSANDSTMSVSAAPRGENVCVCVLGTGRSGTSAATQLLAAIGVSLSSNLGVPNEQNPLGNAEDRHIVDAANALIRRITVSQYFPISIPQFEGIDSEIAELGAYIAENVKKQGIWAFKDPRSIFLLPAYRRIFNKQKLLSRYVLCVRDPAAVVTSFSSNYGDDPELVSLVWLSKNLAALRETGLNCFILHYERLIEQPGEVAAELAQFIYGEGHVVDLDPEQVAATIRPEFNRSILKPRRIENPLIIRLYEVLRSCHGVDFDREALRDVVLELSQIEATFAPWAYSAGEAVAALRKRIAALEKSETTQKERQRSAITLQQQVNETSARVSALLAENQELLRANLELRNTVDDLAAHTLYEASSVAEAREKLFVTPRQVRQMRRELEDARRRVQELEMHHPDLRARVGNFVRRAVGYVRRRGQRLRARLGASHAD